MFDLFMANRAGGVLRRIVARYAVLIQGATEASAVGGGLGLLVALAAILFFVAGGATLLVHDGAETVGLATPGHGMVLGLFTAVAVIAGSDGIVARGAIRGIKL
jgi:hypothetical protein